MAAQAELLANGLAPDVLALAPDAYASLIGESAASGYAQQDHCDPGSQGASAGGLA